MRKFTGEICVTKLRVSLLEPLGVEEICREMSQSKVCCEDPGKQNNSKIGNECIHICNTTTVAQE